MIDKLKRRVKIFLFGEVARGTPVSSLPSGYTTTHPTHTLKYQIWKRVYRIASSKHSGHNQSKPLS